jgi:hypothetical protein
MARKITTAQRRALRAEARAWDEVSDEEFSQMFAEATPVRTRLRRPPPRELPVPLDEQTLNRLRRVARRKQVGPRHLAALWIAERLRQESLVATKARRTG